MALGDIFAIRNGPNTFDGEQKGNFLGLGPHYDLGAFATVAEVIAAIGQDDASIGLTPRVTRVLAGDTEFGANILFRPTGGILNVNGHLLVVMEMADPGPIQVFDVSVAGSEVVFSPHIKVRPEWFAAAGDAKVGSGSVVQGNAVVSINGDNPFTQADIGKTVHVGIVHRLIIISTDGSDFATLHRTSPIGVEHVDAYVDGVLRSNDARVFEGSNALFAVGGAWTVADEDKVVTFHKSSSTAPRCGAGAT